MTTNGFPKIQINFNVRQAQGHILETSTLVNLRGDDLSECVNLFNSLKKKLNCEDESRPVETDDFSIKLLNKSTGEKACPECGAQMVLRTARNGKSSGKQFFGCERYPMCEATLPC